MEKTACIAYLAALGVMSLLALALYGADKARARRGARRIRERTLLLAGVFGGAAGALIGMRAFRHKTRHAAFWAVNLSAAVLQAAGALALLWLWRGAA